MGSLPDSKYIIQTDGYYFVESHDVDPSKGYITVSAKGVINGLSNIPNDGADFGPDSYDPNSTASIPYTQTSGTQESVNYIYKNINTITAPDGSSYVDGFFPKIKFLDGVFNFTSGVIIPATGGIIFEGSGIKTTTLHDASANGITLFSINQSVTQPSDIANFQFNMFSEFTISAGTKTVSLIDLTQTANNITSHNNIHNVFAFGQCSGPMLNWYGNSDSYIEDIQIEPGTAGDVMVQWYTDNPMIRGLRNSKVIGIIKVSGSIITVEDSTIGGIHIEESTIFSGMINTIGIKNTYINSSPNIPIIINLNSPTIGNLTFNNVFFTSTGTSPGQSIFGYGTNFEFLGGLSFIGCNFFPISGTSLFQNNGSGGTFLSPPLVQFLSAENTFYTNQFGALSNVPFDISQGFANTNAVTWYRLTKKRNITTSTPAAPTATTSTSYVMCGFGISFTPSSSGIVKVKWITQGGTNTGIASMSVEALYGTGTAPTNGTAVTGTVIGSPMSVQSTTAGLIDQTMMFEGIVNLTVNTTYWLDLAFLTANASDSAALGNTTVIIEEIE